MRGWVYIITTKAMPDLLKVGFTLKDPDLRAQELGRTGLPHPYVVEFEVLVIHPRVIEEQVHASLKSKREGKEWFRCSVPHAISVIREVVGSSAILERVRGSFNADEKSEARELTEEAEPIQQKEFRGTATYSGACTHCGSRFTVTLVRYEPGARCPNCFRINDTSEFEWQEFIT